jgi:hypothetical protein
MFWWTVSGIASARLSASATFPEAGRGFHFIGATTAMPQRKFDLLADSIVQPIAVQYSSTPRLMRCQVEHVGPIGTSSLIAAIVHVTR